MFFFLKLLIKGTLMKAIGQSASIKDFKDFNYIYIDKTEQIYSLLGQRRVFFLVLEDLVNH